MKKENLGFSIRYKGPSLDDGSMEINELAPSLLALSESIKEIRNLFYPEDENLSLKIASTKKGSFIVDLVLSLNSFTEVFNLLNSDPVNGMMNLKEIINLLNNYIEFVKKTKNQKIVSEEKLKNNKTKVKLPDGTEIITDRNILILFYNDKFKNDTNKFVKPLKDIGIDELDLSYENGKTTTISKEEVDYFNADSDDNLEENIVESILEIKTVAFTEGQKWKFFDGDNTFFARITDYDFDKVNNKKINFGSSDELKVKLKIKQIRTKEGLKKEYEIIKVIKYIPGDIQTELNI